MLTKRQQWVMKTISFLTWSAYKNKHEKIIIWIMWLIIAIPSKIRGGGYLVQKTLRWCAVNMGSKISLLVYEWPLIKCKIWYMNGSIFQNLAKIGSNLRKFWTMVILFKIGPIGIWMGYFFLKNWYLYGLLSNSVVGHPYQNQTLVPPGPKSVQFYFHQKYKIKYSLKTTGWKRCNRRQKPGTCSPPYNVKKEKQSMTTNLNKITIKLRNPVNTMLYLNLYFAFIQFQTKLQYISKLYVMRYSKRYLMSAPTCVWFLETNQ